MRLLTVVGVCAALAAACSGENASTPQGGTSSTQAGSGSGGATGATGSGPATSGPTTGGPSTSGPATGPATTSGSATGSGGSQGSGTQSGAGGAATSGSSGGTGGSQTGGSAGASGGSAGSGDVDGGLPPPPDGGPSPDGGTIDGPGPASQEPFDWGKAVADTRLANSFGSGYVDGLAMHGIYLLYKRLKDPKYLSAVNSYAHSHAGDSVGSLDSVMHMTALADAAEAMADSALKTGADKTRAHFNNYPTTDDVFWHSPDKTKQLWGDGVFMSLSFLSRYGTVYRDTSTYPLMVSNLVNTAKHLRNPDTGLLWHAYDATGGGFAIPPSNTNKISWGRAMGWWVMASAMSLEALPANAPGRADIENALRDLIIALAKYQDKATGRWYQVVDKGTDAENWLETSCSSMFSYGTWWAYKHRLVDATYADVARKGLKGVLEKVTKDASNKTTVHTICEGLNASTDLVGNYYHHAQSDNDPHGIGAFLLMWEGMQ